MVKPLAIDLFCGLGGWTEGYEVIGFDIERHDYGTGGYPAQLVLQDVMTIHGSQFKEAALIVASPPCQEYSYMAMPWSIAKQKRREYLDGTRDRKDLTALFDACFRIQREASEAASHHIPLVVENVRGACEWVGRSRWNYGSFHLWGDVPALMPQTKAIKVPGFRFDGSGQSFHSANVEETGVKAAGMNWSDPTLRGQHFTRIAAGQKIIGYANKRDGHSHTRHLTNQAESDGIKGNWLGWDKTTGKRECVGQRATGSGSKARKAASAEIAKIPFPLSRHIAKYWKPA